MKPIKLLPFAIVPSWTTLSGQSKRLSMKIGSAIRAPWVEECSTRAQFLCLGTYLRSSSGSKAEDVARPAHQAWAALSRAAHFHPYELLPTREELLAWDEVVMEVVEATEKEWR